MSTSLIVHQLELGPMQNFVYIIACSQTREAAVIDPGWKPQAILKTIKDNNLKLEGIMLTHTHFDHVSGITEILKNEKVPIYVHQNEAGALQSFKELLKLVGGEDIINIGQLKIRCIYTPGHTPGSQCFLVENSLFSGDTLFIDYCGRCDLEGSNIREMFNSMSRLRNLDDEVILYPGHHYSNRPTSTMGVEKKKNVYLKCTSMEEFIKEME